MDFLYYKSERGNFGDDLNPWLWEQLFKKHYLCDAAFIGIGTVLYPNSKLIRDVDPLKQKIVFGAGVRPTAYPFSADSTWNIRFLRGPLSNFYLKNDYNYITDAAYAIRLLDYFEELKNEPKKYNVSIMPHFGSVQYFDWESISKELGFHYISPFSENGVWYTLKEIAASRKVITEAMHGAIVADILRVPWHRFVLSTPYLEGEYVAEFKWADWLLSVGFEKYIHHTKISNYYRNGPNNIIRKMTRDRINTNFFIKSRVKKDILGTLSKNDSLSFYLSEDRMLREIDNKMSEQVLLIENECVNF